MDEVKLGELLGEAELSEPCENKEDYISDNLITINTSKLGDFRIDMQEFKRGIDSVSFLCGAITALVNIGINPNKAMDYVADKEATGFALKHNVEIAEIQRDTSIETAKLNFVDRATAL